MFLLLYNIISAEIICLFSQRIDQCAERIKAVAHQSRVFYCLPQDLLLDGVGSLFALIFPSQYDQMPVFRVVPDICAQYDAEVRYVLKLLVCHHVSAFNGFASMGENFTQGNPSSSQ